MKKYVDVILPLPLPKYFTYSLPDERAEEVEIGCRVIVPFGRKKFYTAIVRNVHYCAPTEYEVKDISALLDASPILLSTQFKFWEWLADYYLCTQGDVYKAALPSGLKLESETIVEYNPDFEADAPLSEREQRILDLLSVDSQQCVTKLEKESGMKNILTVIKSLLDKEAIFVKEELRRTYKPKTEARVRLAGYADEKRLHILFDILSRAPKQLALLMKYVECSGILGRETPKEVSKKELLQRAGVSPSILNGLVEKKIFEIYFHEVGRLNQEVKEVVELNAFAVVVLNLVAVLRGTERVEVFARELSHDSIRRSNATVVMSLSVLFLFIFILSMLEPQASLMALTFECVSALSTVGSSLNLTPSLCDASKLLVALLMFIGRVGLITLMLGIVKQKKNTKYRYPSDNIIIN